ncbi:hypothetical protein M885DRAFT_530639 [Pelagophyceae sp. CCMP2097]|nr:hypothetical protein M885DRAFT_530639 [Pelagophyceae sp. CCMP2097]|mmetsp:Transcript_16200/g.54633  ORF Transcript_16200/g.54633 Transcript_16200/m.54633 type:complete len:195 (+) Transcript_16200:65-649(+)
MFKLLITVVAACSALQTGTRTARRSVTMMVSKAAKKAAKYPNAGVVRVVFLKDAQPHGKEGDVLATSRGFALNYLTPRGLAVPASPEIIAEAEAKKAALFAEDEAKREAALEVASKLVAKGGKYSIARKGGDDGMFGSVSSSDILSVIKAATGTDLEGTKVTLTDAIEGFGDYAFTLKLHSKVSVELTLSLVAA